MAWGDSPPTSHSIASNPAKLGVGDGGIAVVPRHHDSIAVQSINRRRCNKKSAADGRVCAIDLAKLLKETLPQQSQSVVDEHDGEASHATSRTV